MEKGHIAFYMHTYMYTVSIASIYIDIFREHGMCLGSHPQYNFVPYIHIDSMFLILQRIFYLVICRAIIHIYNQYQIGVVDVCDFDVFTLFLCTTIFGVCIYIMIGNSSMPECTSLVYKAHQFN